MMKRLPMVALLLLVVAPLLLGGCGKETTTPLPDEDYSSNQYNSNSNKAKSLVESFAPEFAKTAKEIKATTVHWEPLIANLPGWEISNTYTTFSDDTVDFDKLFEGWVRYRSSDGLGDYEAVYLKDNLACIASMTLPLTEEEAFDDNVEDLRVTNEHSTAISCVEFTKEQASPLDFTFTLFGVEPFWNGELRLDHLSFNSPDRAINFYLSKYKKSEATLLFEGSWFNEGKDELIKGNIKKSKCNDGMSDENYDYEVNVSFGGESYQGCAKKGDNFFVEGRGGLLSNFLKKTGYSYRGSRDPKTINYEITSIHGNFIEINSWWEAKENMNSENYEENWEFLILRNTNTGWETYTAKDINEETCKRLQEDDATLREWSIFQYCNEELARG